MYIQTPREIKTLSPTSLSAWLRCRADWYNRYITKAPREGTWNMMVGNAVHRGTDLMHQGKDWELGVRDFWDEHCMLLSHDDCPDLDEVLTLLRVYQQMNPPKEGDKSEEYFKVEVAGLSRPLTGIFDLIPGDGSGVVEFKTGGWWTQARADLAMQTIHYSLAFREIYGVVPRSFTYYAFEFSTMRVRRIRTGVSGEEIDDFIPYVAQMQKEMESYAIIPRCLFKDNNQTCWYPEECAKLMEGLKEKRVHVERVTSSESRPKRRKGKALREGSKDIE